MPLEAAVRLKRLTDPAAARTAALAALATGFLARVGMAVYMGLKLHWPDERAYLAHARRIAGGEWLGPHGLTFIPPGQYYTMGMYFKLVGTSLFAARVFELAVSTASVWLLYRLVRRFSPGMAALAAWGVALYPLIVYTSSTLYPQTLAQFYLLCMLNLLSDHVERPSAARLAPAGVFMGLTALTVPTMLTVSPVVAAWLWWARRFGWRALLEVAALALVCALTISPWIVRNYIVEHRFIPIATVGSQIFFFANNPNADPDCKDLAILGRVYTPEIKAEVLRTGDEDGVYMRHALAFIREEPGRFALFYVKRLGHFFDFIPRTFSHHVHNETVSRLIVGCTSTPVLLLALFGAWSLLWRGRVAALWVLLPLAWGVASAVFGVTIRYRVPVEPLILTVAAWSVWRHMMRKEEIRHEAREPGESRAR